LIRVLVWFFDFKPTSSTTTTTTTTMTSKNITQTIKVNVIDQIFSEREGSRKELRFSGNVVEIERISSQLDSGSNQDNNKTYSQDLLFDYFQKYSAHRRAEKTAAWQRAGRFEYNQTTNASLSREIVWMHKGTLKKRGFIHWDVVHVELDPIDKPDQSLWDKTVAWLPDVEMWVTKTIQTYRSFLNGGGGGENVLTNPVDVFRFAQQNQIASNLASFIERELPGSCLVLVEAVDCGQGKIQLFPRIAVPDEKPRFGLFQCDDIRSLPHPSRKNKGSFFICQMRSFYDGVVRDCPFSTLLLMVLFIVWVKLAILFNQHCQRYANPLAPLAEPTYVVVLLNALVHAFRLWFLSCMAP